MRIFSFALLLLFLFSCSAKKEQPVQLVSDFSTSEIDQKVESIMSKMKKSLSPVHKSKKAVKIDTNEQCTRRRSKGGEGKSTSKSNREKF